MDDQGAEQPASPRQILQIFDDLRTLVQSDGALHELSSIIYRDWVVTVDLQEGRLVDDPERRWSTSKLNTNELMLLLGLLVQSKSDRTYTAGSRDESFVARVDGLLRELHDRVFADGAPTFDPATTTFIELPNSIGLLGREAIYYGPDSFYLHQLLDFARHRYREDATWLLQNVGLSIRPMIDIVKFIVDRIGLQMAGMGHLRNEGHEIKNSELTSSLVISKAELRKKFGAKADLFFTKFVTPAVTANQDFIEPFAINAVAIAPLIDLGEYLYVPNEYRLVESVYASPFYWMIADDGYATTAAEHRGEFLEKTAAHILRAVFGADNVHENVALKKNGRDIAGEIDVLVTYGEFAIVVQAKSKRITLKARAGDSEALRKDFEGAVQAPYRQALKCIELIRSGAKCETKAGRRIDLHFLPRFFPMVTLSDAFRASTLLSQRMLDRTEGLAPVVWDIGVLDCVARLLPTPIELLFYLKSRSDVFVKVLSDSEYNYLGFHIKTKLAMHPDFDGMYLERDFATVVDDYMISADVGIEAKRPVGVLERLKVPVVCELLAELKKADPRVASLVVDLYDFSSAALEEISKTIVSLRKEVAATGKSIKAFSIPTKTAA